MIIVGGGFAGLQTGIELYEHGKVPLVVEAGASMLTAHINALYDSSAVLKMWLDPVNNDGNFWRPWVSKSPPHYSEWSCLRKCVGGRSLYWQGVTLPIEEWALIEPWWPTALIHDLTRQWEGGNGLYHRLLQEAVDWSVFPILYNRDSLGELSRELFKTLGLEEVEIATSMVRHERLANGQMRCVPYSPVEEWKTFVPTSARENAENIIPKILPNTKVLSIEVNNGEVKGVWVSTKDKSEPQFIRSRNVVLAAGTMENSRLAIPILYQAGILREPELRGLYDHIVQGFIVSLRLREVSDKVIESIAPGPPYMIRGDGTSRSNLFISLQFKREENLLVFDVWTMGEQLPTAENFVRCLLSKEESKASSIRVNASLSPEDMEVISMQREALQDVWERICKLFHHPMSKLEFPDFMNPSRTLRDALFLAESLHQPFGPIAWVSPLGTVDHEGGTLPYGSILRNNGEIKGVKGIFAVGPSTFPRAGAANPTLTTMALARRIAYFVR